METASTTTATTRSPRIIELPWRAFKAFVQLYDLDEGTMRIPPGQLLVFSDTRGGELIRSQLSKYRLITLGHEGRYVVLRGTPLGRTPVREDPANPIVQPQTRSTTGAAWIASQGRCSYCGTPLTFFAQLALSTVIDGAPMFACKSCHAMRGTRSLDEMRFLAGMKEFERQHGVRFDRRQVHFLEQLGVELDIPDVTFWFEQHMESEEKRPLAHAGNSNESPP